MKRLLVIPEIFIWIAFSVVTGFGYAFAFLGYIDSHSQVTVMDIALPALVWLLLGAICTFVLRAMRSSKSFVKLSRCESVFLESSVLALLIVGGWIFRFVDYFHGVWPADVDMTFFQYAQVSTDAMTYINPHPISRLYVLFLHIVCLFLGNVYEAGAFIQFVLLLVGVLLWYFAIRRAMGPITALFFVAGAMLLPDSIVASLQCNPTMLLFVLYGMVALLIVEYAMSDATGFILYMQVLLLGIFSILAFWLDISGVLVIIAFALAIYWREKRGVEGRCRFTGLFACLGIFAGDLLFIVAQMRIYGLGFYKAAQYNCYQGLSLSVPDLTQLKEFVFELGAYPILGVAVVVIVAYWFSERKLALTWLMFGELYLLGVRFLKLDTYMGHDFAIYIGLLVLVGVCIQQLFVHPKEDVRIDDEAEAEPAEMADTVQQEEPQVTVICFDEEPAITVPAKKQVESDVLTAEEVPAKPMVEETGEIPAKPTVEETKEASEESLDEPPIIIPGRPLIYIPKTMEIPKRVSKPKVDFALEVAEERMHFDYPVDDDADFDI